MVKRPNFNPGAFGKPLPDVDMNPETNDAVAHLVDGAAVKTDLVTKSKAAPAKAPPPVERFLPKFSLAAEHIEALDESTKRFRVASGGADCSMSRIVAAGLLALADLPDDQLVAAVERVPMRKAGRRPGIK